MEFCFCFFFSEVFVFEFNGLVFVLVFGECSYHWT